MKVVCMCQGGNSRSVACGYVLKYECNIDAIACGWEKNSPETLAMLFTWADAIIVMQEHFRQYVPEQFHDRLIVIDAGQDVWFNSLHPELIKKCELLLANQMDKLNELHAQANGV